MKREMQGHVCLELCAAVCLCWVCVSVNILVANGLGLSAYGIVAIYVIIKDESINPIGTMPG